MASRQPLDQKRLDNAELWQDFESRLQSAEGTSFTDLLAIVEQADWREICRELGYSALRTARLLKLIHERSNLLSTEGEPDPALQQEGRGSLPPNEPLTPEILPATARKETIPGGEPVDSSDREEEEEAEAIQHQIDQVTLESFAWLPRPELIANELRHVIVDERFPDPEQDSSEGTPRAEDFPEEELNAYSDYGHLPVHNDDFHRMNQESWLRLLHHHSISHPSVTGESVYDVEGHPAEADYSRKIRSRLRFSRSRPRRSHLINQGVPEGPRMAHQFRDFLVQGGLVMKHGRKGSPRERHVSVSSDLRVIMWGRGAQHQLPTHLMKLITTGCATWVLERSRPKDAWAAKIWEDKCFSLVFIAGLFPPSLSLLSLLSLLCVGRPTSARHSSLSSSLPRPWWGRVSDPPQMRKAGTRNLWTLNVRRSVREIPGSQPSVGKSWWAWSFELEIGSVIAQFLLHDPSALGSGMRFSCSSAFPRLTSL